MSCPTAHCKGYIHLLGGTCHDMPFGTLIGTLYCFLQKNTLRIKSMIMLLCHSCVCISIHVYTSIPILFNSASGSRAERSSLSRSPFGLFFRFFFLPPSVRLGAKARETKKTKQLDSVTRRLETRKKREN